MSSRLYSANVKENLRALVIALLHGTFRLPAWYEGRTRGTNSQYKKSASVATEEEEEGEAAAAVMTPSPYGAPSH